jgi:phosphonate transport system ATP-binding protein
MMPGNNGGSGPAIEVVNLNKTYSCCKALSDINLSFEPGQMVALIGASGSGKSTLLRLIAGLTLGDRDPGEVRVLGQTIQNRGVLSRDIHRTRRRIGFIFQQFNLVDRLPLLLNVLAGRLGRMPVWRSALYWFTQSEKHMAMEALGRVGMADFSVQRASTLSGGQKQRAAIAKALVQQAEVILADEPIASLDPESSRQVMEILREINRQHHITVLVSLHQVEFAMHYCPHVVALKQGRVVYAGATAGLTGTLLNSIYNGKTAAPGRAAKSAGVDGTKSRDQDAAYVHTWAALAES